MHGIYDVGWLHKHDSLINKASLYKRNFLNGIENMDTHRSLERCTLKY